MSRRNGLTSTTGSKVNVMGDEHPQLQRVPPLYFYSCKRHQTLCIGYLSLTSCLPHTLIPLRFQNHCCCEGSSGLKIVAQCRDALGQFLVQPIISTFFFCGPMQGCLGPVFGPTNYLNLFLFSSFIFFCFICLLFLPPTIPFFS